MEIFSNNYFWRFLILCIIIYYFIRCSDFNSFCVEEPFFNIGFNLGSTTESSSPGTLMCAKSCCYSGWPASINIDESHLGVKSGDMGKKYRATNLKCNNGFTTGCVCDLI